jgi:hypothetical protein
MIRITVRGDLFSAFEFLGQIVIPPNSRVDLLKRDPLKVISDLTFKKNTTMS